MKRATLLVPLLLGFSAAAALGACGDDDGEDAIVEQCRDVGTTICAEACACGECRIDAGDGVTIGFESEDDCLDFYAGLACMSPDESIDLDACSADLANAECTEDPMGGSDALALPDSCASDS